MPDAIRFKVDDEVIYPGPIEDILSTHPSIRAVSVSMQCNVVICSCTTDWDCQQAEQNVI